jgi:putative nucleotidyltransferase with HDIG domain
MKRILFVDDEQLVLDGLRDLLRAQRHEWKMVFALGGDAALAELEAEPFDVVVSDMRMPGLDGAQLLALVQERHPESVRIVLSGQTELEEALRTVPVAHQCLAKPCSPDDLRHAIERAILSQTLLEDAAVRRAVASTEALPSAPTLYTKLVETLADPDGSVADVGRLVESDIAMCAKVLQLVNSSFFGLGRQISSAREAVIYLGMAPLRALVLSAGAFRAFAPARPIEGFSVEGLEAHSLLVARVASDLLTGKRESEDAFTAGLLHDVGKLVLAAYGPDDLAAMLAEARASGRPLHFVERERVGVTHAEIGAYLLTLWGLPHRIVEAVAHHHSPIRIPGTKLDSSAAVHIAVVLVDGYRDDGIGGAPQELDLVYLEELGVADRVDAWQAIAARQVGQAVDAA